MIPWFETYCTATLLSHLARMFYENLSQHEYS